MQIVPALNKIMGILDQEDPTKYLSSLLSLLGNMEKSAARSGLDDEILDMIHDYTEAWTVEGAIEEDIDSFAEETYAIYDAIAEDDEGDEDDEDDEDDDY